MTITWILVAHGSAGKILEVRKNGEEISVVKEFVHPQTAKKDGEFSTQHTTGSFESKELSHHAMDYSGEIEAHERHNFAREITDYLATALTKKMFSNLILVASPNLLGELRKAVPTRLKRVIAHQLDKDLLSQGFSDAELVETIRDDLALVCF